MTQKITWIHSGHTITFRQVDAKFVVTGPHAEVNKDESFLSLKEAQGAIDNWVKASGKSKKWTYIARDKKGEQVKVTGLHSGRCRLLGLSEQTESIFPDIPWVVTDLVRIQVLLTQVEVIRKRVDQFRMRVQRGYGRVSPDAYVKTMEEFEKEFAQKTKDAEALGRQ